MKSIIRSAFSLVVMGAMIFPLAAQADAAKCSPCQLAKSMRDALAQSIKDVQMAALAAGGSFSRQSTLDAGKCGCARTTRDELSGELVLERCCGCQRTCRDGVVGDLEKCGCQKTCRDGMAAVAAAARAVAKESELDEVPADASRAPREELADPCNPCGDIEPCKKCCTDPCLRTYISILNQRIIQLEKDSKKCCKKLGHKIHDVEELIESVIDTSAECCSVIETTLGDPAEASFLDIPLCAPITVADAIINGSDADILTWLKTITELVYRIHSCVCCLQ